MSPADAALAARDRRLHARLRDELERAGAFRPARLASGLHMGAVLGVYFGAYAGLLAAPEAALRGVLLVGVAAAGVQAGLIAHQLGHARREPRRARLLAHLFLTFLNGYAAPQYRAKHQQHHREPNRAGLDPDLEADGLLSFHPEAARTRQGAARLLSVGQAWLIWPLLLFVAFSARKDSVATYLWTRPGHHRVEPALLLAHYALWLGPPMALLGPGDALLNYAIAAALMGPYLAATVLPNHLGMPVLDRPWTGSSLRRTLLTTRNLGSGWLRDYLFAGTNNHIEHHLFPQLPMHRLGAARRVTRSFCARHGLPYHERSWPSALAEVVGHLRRMGRLARGPRAAEPLAGRSEAVL